MNKRGREKNFAFGTTDQSNSHRKPLLMRAVQEKKGGRQGVKEKKSMACHSYTEEGERKGEMNHTQRLVEEMSVCVHIGWGWWWLFEGCFQDHFNIFTEGASEARPG